MRARCRPAARGFYRADDSAGREAFRSDVESRAAHDCGTRIPRDADPQYEEIEKKNGTWRGSTTAGTRGRRGR